MRRARVIELPLVPGALSDDTDLAASLHAIDMDKVRSRGKRWETIKGWTAFNASGMSAGIARGGHAWASLTGLPCVMMCSQSAINAWINGSRLDITPKWADAFIDLTHITLSGSSMTIDWYVFNPASGTSELADHYLQVGDSVTISGLPYTGGSYDPNGTRTIATVPTPSQFTLTPSGSAPTKAGAGGAATITVAFRAGLATGTGDLVSQKTRVYSISNFGEDGVFCGSDGTPVWHFQPATSYPELITSGNFSSSSGWTTGSNWTIGAGVASHGAAVGSSNLSQNIDGDLEGGKVYEMAFTVSSMDNDTTLAIKIDSIKIHPDLGPDASGGSGFNRTYTFRFVCPANPTNLIFTATGTAAGGTVTLDNVSIKLLSIAHRINEAPQKNYALFVDANAHILAVLGSVEADGDFNPLLYRWCDQDNFREWIPDTDNVAGELSLAAGSMAVCGGTAGSIALILTDDAAFASLFSPGAGYTLQLIGQGCGAVGARALAIHNNIAFWAGIKGFHAFDGARVLNVECPIKDRYVTKLRQYQENKTFAWINTEYGEVWFHYAHTSDGTEVSRYAVYNFLEQGNPWSFGTFDRTTWIRPTVFQYPIAVDASGNIWSHETGTSLSGSITLPFLETGYVTAQAGDTWLGCRRYYPDIEGQTGDITWTITGKRAPQGTSDTQAISKTLTTNLRKVDFLLSMRQGKFKWASAATPTNWRLGVVGLEMITDRERR